MQRKFYGVIMAGGVGSRFWPLSRKKLPKQFIDVLNTGETMFQATWNRLRTVCEAENIFVVTNEMYRDLIQTQVPEMLPEQILGEPHARNTAPCIAYACSKIAKKDPEAVIAVLPSDHLVLDTDIFAETFRHAFDFCSRKDVLLTLGIQPTRPDTGYGYIQFDEDSEEEGIYKVKTFTEKPSEELAEYFVRTGEFAWNSGMFIWSAKAILGALSQHLPDLYETFHKLEKFYYTPEEPEQITRAYERSQIISIDYGIMEKASNVYVLPATFQWSDIGTWNALYSYSKKDEDQNVVRGDMVMLRNAQDCIVHVPNKKLVVLNNVSNLIVVEADGILLVADKEKEQDIRHVVNDIKIRYGEKFV